MILLKLAFPAWEQAQAQARSLLGEAGADLLIEAVDRLPAARPPT